jgi:hypothetical protein
MNPNREEALFALALEKSTTEGGTSAAVQADLKSHWGLICSA